MTETPVETENSQSEAPRRPRSKLLTVVVAMVAVFVLYEGVRWGFRYYTTGLVHGVVGRALPPFSLEDRQGRVWASNALRGKKIVLNFFRSRCANCWKERDVVRQFAAELDAERVVFLGVMMDAVQGYPAEVSEKTLIEFAFEHPVVMADDKFVAAFHGVGWSHITPITYVADEQGDVVAALRYPYGIDDLRGAVK